MLYTFDHLREGLTMLLRHFRVRGRRFTRLGKNAETIARLTLKHLWTGTHFKTSLGHYPVFYSRDFGMMVPSLLHLGFRGKIRETLEYALHHYSKAGHIATFINQKGTSVNFPNVYSPDSVAYLFRSIRLLGDAKLFARYKSYLQQELDHFFATAIDERSGLIKEGMHFSSMRDHSKRNVSCYDTVMAAVLSKEADLLGLRNPLQDYDYPRLLIDNFWTGTYFKDALHDDTMTADANIYPFWLDIITDERLLQTAISSLQKEHLDKPFPIRYVASRKQKGKTIFLEHLVPDWESTAVWPMSGLPFIELVLRFDKPKAQEYLVAYKLQIESFGTFVEVYDQQGIPYRSLVFSADEGMIWVALWLDMYTKH